jgi:probable DNA metabolism protein
MDIFYYDKSFDGLLSAVFDAYARKSFPHRLLAEGETAPLTAGSAHHVESSAEKALRVYKGLRKRLSRRALGMLHLAWLSEEPGSDALIFRYIRNMFDTPDFMEADPADPDTFALWRTAGRVSCEAHLLRGMARFQKTAQGVYFAAIGPKHDCLTLLLPHFMDRCADRHWMIYDVKRGYGMFFDGRDCHEAFLPAEGHTDGTLRDDLLAEDEKLFQIVWQGYCKALSIKERVNPKLQRRCMPRRFWPYLTEKRELTSRAGAPVRR